MPKFPFIHTPSIKSLAERDLVAIKEGVEHGTVEITTVHATTKDGTKVELALDGMLDIRYLHHG
jgi:hypothetical protein